MALGRRSLIGALVALAAAALLTSGVGTGHASPRPVPTTAALAASAARSPAPVSLEPNEDHGAFPGSRLRLSLLMLAVVSALAASILHRSRVTLGRVRIPWPSHWQAAWVRGPPAELV